MTSSTGTPKSAVSNLLPSRFSDLKKELWNDALIQSWNEILTELKSTVEEITTKGANVIPRVTYADMLAGLSDTQVKYIKKIGVVIITGGVPRKEALDWKQSIKDYVSMNAGRITGYPPDNIQIYEMYNSKGQVAARTHPAIIESQRRLLSLWHISEPMSEIDLEIPISYFDRVRIRHPGDDTFVLDPHIDNGSVERWEDPTYRQCYNEILKGGAAWRNYDAFDASPRLDAKQVMYDCSNQGSVFRAWQGWTSLSHTGPGEGTLRVLPMLGLSTAYIILRPFFRLKEDSDEWELDLDGTSFPGSLLGGKQFLTPTTHPHLELDKTMVSIPLIEPGDQVYWHCDTVHEVEAKHRGKDDSSVIYTPAVPLTIKSALYLRNQRTTFEAGLPAPDFGKGPGESNCMGRATASDVTTVEGRQALGLQPFENNAGSNFLTKVNDLLF